VISHSKGFQKPVSSRFVDITSGSVHCPPRCMLDRSADQPTQRTVANDRLIYPPYIWVDTPICEVKNLRFGNRLEGLITLTPGGGIIGLL